MAGPISPLREPIPLFSFKLYVPLCEILLFHICRTLFLVSGSVRGPLVSRFCSTLSHILCTTVGYCSALYASDSVWLGPTLMHT